MQNSDTGTTAFNDFAAHGLEQCFDFPPFNIAGNRVSEDGIQSFSMVPVHTDSMISLFATKSRKKGNAYNIKLLLKSERKTKRTRLPFIFPGL